MTIQQQKFVHVEWLPLPKENCYDSILVCNISQNDHAKGDLDETKLQSLKGIPRFIDNLFIFRYLYEAKYTGNGKKNSLK